VNSEYLVLVVEDDSSAYEMLRHCLRRAGHFVLVWAENAAEGLAEIPKQAFDIVLLDLTLPDSRGLDTVKVFTETSSGPVVQQERELRRLEADANQAFNAPASGRQDVPLSQSCADHFSHAVGTYSELIDEALEQRQYKVENKQMLPVSEKAGTADEFGDSRSQYSGLSMDADG